MRVSVVVCVLALLALVCGASALHPDVALLSSEEQASLSRAMNSWPADEIMPLLASDELAAFDAQDDHALVEADSEMEAEAEAEAEADSELDAELDSELDAELDSELDAELDAEADAEEDFFESSHLEAGADAAMQAEVSDALLEQLMFGDASGVDDAVLAQVHAMAGQSVAGQAKGGHCGSGWTAKIVPDYNMGPACAVHDKCYARCLVKQTTCDTQFLNNMKNICKKKYPSKGLAVKLRLCNTQANVYYSAVKRLGGAAFKKGQAKACAVKRHIA